MGACRATLRFFIYRQRTFFTVILLATACFTACSPAPDIYPAGTKVSTRLLLDSDEKLELGPKSSQLFLDMLATTPVRSNIGDMPAVPTGFFYVGENVYVWHGNGVIRGTGSAERLWHGPFLQRLIQELHDQPQDSQEDFQKILDKLENDPSVASTPLEGPGAYPGGADALHPVGFPPTEENGWQKFEPEQKK